MAKSFKLPKNERIKGRKLIQHLFDEGDAFVVLPYRIYYLIEKTTSGMVFDSLRFGIGVGAKVFSRSVDRNRIKRLTREAWRLQKNDLQQLAKQNGLSLAVFLVYTVRDMPDFSTVKGKVGVALQRLFHLVEQFSVPR